MTSIDSSICSSRPLHLTENSKAQAERDAQRDRKMLSKDLYTDQANMKRSVPRFHRDEIKLGDVVGMGGYCAVFEIKSIQTDRLKNGPLLTKHLSRKNSRKFVVKRLSDETKKDPHRSRIGAAELDSEARLLATLNHPNIIKLQGVSSGVDTEYSHFLILDRLETTLDKKLDEWRAYARKKLTRKIWPVSVNKQRRSFLVKRLGVAYSVASALRYMHEKDVIFGDIKPENVGFDLNGQVQLFDMGLAQRVEHNGATKTAFKLSGNIGSHRYMAPEVALCQPYTPKADSYSFGLLLWHLMALAAPFDEMSPQEHLDHVINGNYRPPLDHKWPPNINNLLLKCWEADPSARPDMEGCKTILKLEIVSLLSANEQHSLCVDNDTKQKKERPSSPRLEQKRQSGGEKDKDVGSEKRGRKPCPAA